VLLGGAEFGLGDHLVGDSGMDRCGDGIGMVRLDAP